MSRIITNKQHINYCERLIDRVLNQINSDELLFDFDKISENGGNIIYDWSQINQPILEIDIDWTFLKEYGRLTFWRFGISNYSQYSIFRNTFQCHRPNIFKTTLYRVNGC